MNYKNLSIIQSIAISMAGISIFDMGYSNYVFRGIWFNYLLFHMDSLPSFMNDAPFWSEFQFWGYLFLIVAACQLLKVFPPEKTDFNKFGYITGKLGVIIILASPTLAIILNIEEYDFQNQTLSSLVEYGLPSVILMSWGLMVSAILLTPYLIIFLTKLKPQFLSILVISIAVLGMFFLFMIGITLPADEPYNHSVFVNPYWDLMIAFIFLSSIQLALNSEKIINRNTVIGLLISFGMLSLIILSWYVNLPGYVQLGFGITIQLWHLNLINIYYKK